MDKYNKKKKIYYNKLFPEYKNNNAIFEKLKIDDDSVSYISLPIDAFKITKIINSHILNINKDSNENLNPNNMIITDATSGVGGNSISFSQKFKSVNSIEIEPTRYNYLVNNLKVYDINNVNTYNDNCINFLKQSYQDIIFFDPPWGGEDYKNKKKMRLKISNFEIENIILDLIINNPNFTRFFVLKLPVNYDLEFIYNYLTTNTNNQVDIYLYNLDKMIIIIIENKYKKISISNTIFDQIWSEILDKLPNDDSKNYDDDHSSVSSLSSRSSDEIRL